MNASILLPYFSLIKKNESKIKTIITILEKLLISLTNIFINYQTKLEYVKNVTYIATIAAIKEIVNILENKLVVAN